MPEIKHKFTAGKMNKDLDERLVPNGEYRDAMNIQVSTSEGSDIGTVQNILGNEVIDGLDFLYGNASCVGSISNEKDNALYWLVHEEIPKSLQTTPALSTTESPANIESIKASNYILKHAGGQVTVVFADITHKRCISVASPFLDIYANTLTITFISHNFAIGDIITAIQIPGTAYTGVILTIIQITPTSIVIDMDIVFNNTGLNLGDLQAIVGSSVSAYTSIKKPVLGFTGSQITGINIIDDILLWTDGSTEPKKINIPRSIFGTHQSGLRQTKLVVNGQYLGFIEESHITVIKKGPSRAPRLTQLTSSKPDGASLSEITTAPVVLTSLFDGDILGFSVDVNAGFEIGDTLLLTLDVGASPLDPPVRVIVTAMTLLPAGGLVVPTELALATEILTIPSVASVYSGSVLRVNYEETKKNLFKLKFPRFALRYKYEDSEYSPVGPFSNVAFIPGVFDYHPTEAFNLGMSNTLRSLTIEDYIAQDIPKDVTQVDILYKNDTSPSIYIVKSVYKKEAKDVVTGQNTWDANSYRVSTENIYAQLPGNQLLRPWDNVPTAALAQEVVGNRVVYGNYQQNYDMLSVSGLITPSFETFLTAYGNYDNNEGRKSIKSIRTYDFGLVYIDEHGRETPVFADPNAAQTVPKLFSDKSTRFSLSIKDDHPEWADSYKVFIKETSNEYYNLALGRVYDAEDGNVWLSFPSVDRNKVDEETYLILKKSEGVLGAAIEDDNRYKIVAIDNEAPDYIKTNWDVLSEPSIADIRGILIYGLNLSFGGLAPYVGHSRFTIKQQNWSDPFNVLNKNMGLGDLEKLWDEKGEDEIYVFFTENETITDSFTGATTTLPRKSQKYLVTDIVAELAVYGAHMWEVSLSKPISGEDEWITSVVSSDLVVNTNSDRSHPHFYKKVVKNLPEFDGRFFVKIIEDDIISTKLKTSRVIRQNYIVENSLDAYYFQDNIAGSGLGNIQNHNSPLLLNSTGVNVSRTRDAWHKLLKFGGSTKRSGWIIDGVSYAGAERVPAADGSYGLLPETLDNYYMNGGMNDSRTRQYGSDDVLGFTSDFSSYQTYYQAAANFLSSNIYGFGAGGGGGQSNGWGTANSLGIVFGQGIHQGTYTLQPDHNNTGGFVSGTASTDKLFLSLSYLAPVTYAPEWGSKVQAGGGTSNYADVYQNTPALEEMEKSLRRNQRFRIAGNPTEVYKIKGVTERWLFNYKGGVANNWYYEEHGNNDLTYDHQVRRFKERWNRRINFLIEYELVVPGGDDLSTNQALDNVSPVDFARIEFVDDYFEEGPNPISEYPAVFETEPKEDVGLDIYYEATNALPLKLTYLNQQNFAAIGTLVEFTTDWGINGPPGDFYVADWGSGSVDPNVLFLDRDLPQLTVLPFLTGGVVEPHLKFSRPDGSFVYANIVGGYGQYNVPTFNPILNATIQVSYYEGINIQILPNEIGLGWHNCWSFGNGVESNRIGDTYNKPYLTNGAKASTTLLEQYAEEHRKHGLIYSGIYNSNSNTNNLNQFIAAEKITKDINPTYGSIQKLHTRDSNLVVLCEDKILKVTANKDALFNADGNPQLIATDRVLGQAIPFVGEFGISTHPESFASESYRAYFTDSSRGAVIRLSMDGITPISEAGMSDWFKDNLKFNDKIIGSYDDKKNEYNVTLKYTTETAGGYELGTSANAASSTQMKASNSKAKKSDLVARTISFKESIKGWVSFKSFVPENGISCNNEYYTFLNGKLYLHHSENQDRNTFYDSPSRPSKLSVVLNDKPGLVKSFNTLNYEGSKARITQDLGDNQYFNLVADDGWFVDYLFTNKEEGNLNEFIEKEGKWFNYIKGISSVVGNSSDLAGFNVQGLGLQIAKVDSVPGCTDPTAGNYNPLANVDDGSCGLTGIYGCTDPDATNYNSEATIDDGTCTYDEGYYGCTDPLAQNYNPNAVSDDGTCTYVGAPIQGCTDVTANNYDPAAVSDDGTCTYDVLGCTDVTATNYDPTATLDDGSCIAPVYGCTDPAATNYYAGAAFDDGSCTYAPTSNLTYIPDVNFRTYLTSIHGVTFGVAGNAGICYTSDVSAITTMYMSTLGLTDLTGIKDFAALTTLECPFNNITSLDLSQNTALIWLNCRGNLMTNLDIKNGNNQNLTLILAMGNNLAANSVNVDDVMYASIWWLPVGFYAPANFNFGAAANNGIFTSI